MPAAPPTRIGVISFTAHGLKESFYPKKMKADAQLAYYAEHFNTVEIDGTAYRMPSRATVERWHDSVPADFRFTAKLPQQITHRRRLVGCESYITDFYRALEPFSAKALAFLLQMPKYAASKFDEDAYITRLREFFDCVPRTGPRLAVEIRDPERLTPKLIELLNKRSVGLAWVDIPGMPSAQEYLERANELLPTSWSYIRLMGDRDLTSERTETFDKVVVDRNKDIKEWVKVFNALGNRGQELNVYVSAYYEGNAVQTIDRLKRALSS